ncbi:MAG: hypothetical protein ACRBN8_07740 [Nannocystales bacterium]
MIWAVLWSGLAGLAVVGVVMTAAEIQAAGTDDAYFRGSTRLWLFVATVIAAMSLAIAPSILGMGTPASVQATVLGFASLPAVIAVLACLHNALALVRVRNRRSDALVHGSEFDAVVVEREHKPFAHDILSITIETTLPAAGMMPHQGGYRTEADNGMRALRLVETCPGDQWGRLAPGRRVRVRVDPRDPSRYALVLFEAA